MCVFTGKVNVAKWEQLVNKGEEYMGAHWTIFETFLWVWIFPNKLTEKEATVLTKWLCRHKEE